MLETSAEAGSRIEGQLAQVNLMTFFSKAGKIESFWGSLSVNSIH